MKRIELTPAQIEDVIRLRQGGLSWLRIQNETDISRRVAQRAYEEWERARSIRELENVRVKVGEIEFERHLDALTRWAVSLVGHLWLPLYPGFTTDAETYFEKLMDRDTSGPPGEAIPAARDEMERARDIRRNRLLFESLKEHTADSIRWDMLADWREGWDTCFHGYPGLIAGVEEAVHTALEGIPGFDELFLTRRGQNKPLEILKKGIGDVLWRGMVLGDTGAAAGLVRAESIEINEEEVLSITMGGRILIQRENKDMSPSLADICRGIVTELWERDDTKVIRDAVGRMRGVIDEMETALEPLVLRPHILKTRCSICPA